jgi:hypothetical protein
MIKTDLFLSRIESTGELRHCGDEPAGSVSHRVS